MTAAEQLPVTHEEDEAFEQLVRRNEELERDKQALLDELDRLKGGEAA